MSSSSGTLYVGYSSDLERRVRQHKEGFYPNSFSKRYKCNKLVYYEEFMTKAEAIAGEAKVKKWNRNKKELLIGSMNPIWEDLSKDLFI